MTSADFAPIIQAITAGIALLITGLIGIFVPMAIKAFERRTGVQITAQQQATVLGAATTEVGIIKLKLDQGLLRLADIHPDSPIVLDHAEAALERVPKAALAMDKTVPSMAETIVGMVGNAPKGASNETVPYPQSDIRQPTRGP